MTPERIDDARRGGVSVRARSLVAVAAAGYLLGTVPSASTAARAASGGLVDLRRTGSGNPGAANSIAVLGKRWGYAVLVADIGKAAIAGGFGRRVAGDLGAHVGSTAAVIGHCHPVWTGFRGGKGVACSVGQCLTTFPAYFPIDLAVAGLTAAGPWRQRAFTATAVASATWIGASVLWWRRQLPNFWGPRPSPAMPAAATVSSVVVLGRFLAARR